MFLPFFFLFFFSFSQLSASCTVHGTWTVQIGMWTVILKVNRWLENDFLLFSVFSFQQNKWYPNTHSISFFLRIKSEDGDSSISRLSEPHRNFIPWAKKTQCIRYSISMSPLPIKWMLISSHKHWFYNHTDTSFIFSSMLVWKGNNFSKSKSSAQLRGVQLTRQNRLDPIGLVFRTWWVGLGYKKFFIVGRVGYES